MDRELEIAWERLQTSLSPQQGVSMLMVGGYLLAAAGLGLYLRMLFRRSSGSAGDSDSIARVFPLLVVVTTAVIGVVKTSLALSLGFVGALSLVRFRSAIKEPEELVHLFLCVAVGLALGAEVPLLALALVAVATLLAVVMKWLGGRGADQSLLLTITGDADGDFCVGDGEAGVLAVARRLLGPHTLQRLDIENGRGQVRLVLRRTDARRAAELVTQLRRNLPDCEFSYVNLNSSW